VLGVRAIEAEVEAVRMDLRMISRRENGLKPDAFLTNESGTLFLRGLADLA